ncbi:MAG: glycerol-3-phosphate dehydrogenase/oxidase [Bacteroidota bacterium]
MNRNEMLSRIEEVGERWDVIIVGGGATGLGAAIDAAARGYRTLLLEQHDFAKGTSSRSTKLVHGGVRYLQQGNVSLVVEALRERGRMLRNAPHLVHNLPFVVPNYDWWEGPFYGIGLKIYDMLAGKEGFGTSKHLSLEETLERIPTIEPEGLRGGTIYYDGQFDDARLAINMAQTAVDLGGTVANYMKVVGLTKDNDMVRGVVVEDQESGKSYTLSAHVVINATGVFTDAVRQMDDNTAVPMVQPSQGVHIVLDRSFLPGDSAIMVPHTDDGRVLFAIPWHERIVVGTTDTPLDAPALEPRALEDELSFLLEHSQRYLTKDPTAEDVLSTFAGLRPLVRNPDAENTAEISRDHTIQISRSGLVTIAGGKWTTYRKMAEDVIDQAATIAGLPERQCATKDLPIHGWHAYASKFGDLAYFGADAPAVKTLIKEEAGREALLHPNLPYQKGEVIWAVREEMARTVEDVMSRRTRALLLDARASIAVADEVAAMMAKELGYDASWQAEQVNTFTKLARRYLI